MKTSFNLTQILFLALRFKFRRAWKFLPIHKSGFGSSPFQCSWWGCHVALLSLFIFTAGGMCGTQICYWLVCLGLKGKAGCGFPELFHVAACSGVVVGTDRNFLEKNLFQSFHFPCEHFGSAPWHILWVFQIQLSTRGESSAPCSFHCNIPGEIFQPSPSSVSQTLAGTDGPGFSLHWHCGLQTSGSVLCQRLPGSRWDNPDWFWSHRHGDGQRKFCRKSRW